MSVVQCVMTTLVDASFIGYDCILLKDCTATTSPDFCYKAAIWNINVCFGFVSSSTVLLEAMAKVKKESQTQSDALEKKS